jgi:two-component system, LytTR family, response regulator
MSGRLRAVVVEDEPQARQNLRDYCAAVGWLHIAGEAGDGRTAVELIDRLQPELVFLDVRLPELSGLEVVERIRHAPQIVFTTAYDRYALSAFEVGALDFLLKPFGRKRFETAVERVRARLTETQAPLAERARAAFVSPWKRIFARTATGIVPVDVRAIRRAQASGDYVEIHCGSGSHLLHMTLAELEERLDPGLFLRVHRSHIVNLDAVARIAPFDERRLAVELRDGTRIVASRSASEELRRLVR